MKGCGDDSTVWYGCFGFPSLGMGLTVMDCGRAASKRIEKNLEGHVITLNQGDIQGRKTGSAGNQELVAYVKKTIEDMGLEPVAMLFSTPVAQVQKPPVWTVDGLDAHGLGPLEVGKDFYLIPSPYAGSVDYQGDLLLITDHFYTIDPSLMEGKVLVTEFNVVTQDIIERAINNGALGILNHTGTYYPQDFGDQFLLEIDERVNQKKGKRIFLAQIREDLHKVLRVMATDHLIEAYSKVDIANESYMRPIITGYIPGVTLTYKEAYPVQKSENVQVVLPGKDPSLAPVVFTASIDDRGVGPGGLSLQKPTEAGGLAVLLEVLRGLSQGDQAERSLEFVIVNGQVQGGMGLRAYFDQRGDLPPETDVIHLGSLGTPDSPGLHIGSMGSVDQEAAWVLRTKLASHGHDQGLALAGIDLPQAYDGFEGLAQEGIAHSILTDGVASLNHDQVDMDQLKDVAQLVNAYIHRDLLGANRPDYLPVVWAGTVIAILFILFLLNGLQDFGQALPGRTIWGHDIRQLTYSTPFVLGVEVTHFAITILVALVAMIGVLLVPQYFMMVDYGGTYTNFSGYLFGKNIVAFIQDVKGQGLGVQGQEASLLDLMIDLGSNSIEILFYAVVLSLALGMAKGLWDGYRPNAFKGFTSVALLSLPDVLVAFTGLYAMIAILHLPNLPQWVDPAFLRLKLFPVLALSILPSLFIGRTALLAAEEERHRGYIKGVIARGATPAQAYLRHLVPVMFFHVIDALPAMLKLMITNLLIVEFFYGYPGIANYLLTHMGHLSPLRGRI